MPTPLTAACGMLRRRGAEQMDGLLASLTAKYGGKAASHAADEPSDAEFEAAAARMDKKKRVRVR